MGLERVHCTHTHTLYRPHIASSYNNVLDTMYIAPGTRYKSNKTIFMDALAPLPNTGFLTDFSLVFFFCLVVAFSLFVAIIRQGNDLGAKCVKILNLI